MDKNETIRMALEALEIYGEHAKDCPQYPTYTRPQDYPKCDCGYEQAITALREALAEQAEQEPVATMEVFSGWWGKEANFEHLNYDLPDGFYKLYAAPVRTKDLTDDAIDEIFAEYGTIPNTKAVRAVIAKDREKNK